METVKTAPSPRAEGFHLITEDLQRVEKVLALDTICSVDAVNAVNRHLRASGGKRLRPALVLLSARACGAMGDAPIRLAAIMELIHVATLVHDDVIDEANVRRGKPSTNLTWGNHVSVLAGDWLYMQAFNLAVRERDFAVLDLLIDLTQSMVEGELMQSELLGRLDVTQQQHQDLIHRKTASLLAACTRLGALVARLGEDAEERLRNYGWNLGMAFQLIDDVLDFEATEEVLGKPVGNDLKEGKVTLPLILALRSCTAAERIQIETVIREGSYDSVSLAGVLEILDRYDAIKRVRSRAIEFCEAALEGIAALPSSPYKRGLEEIASRWIVERVN